MSDTVIKIENLTKEYQLGVIGSGTLYRDLQSWAARIRGKEDPNKKIGHKEVNGYFMALNGISLEIKKGDTLGLIGGNGAGKSTLLKILSRVTAPTSGLVKINGRIASLLEVGTGFHPELTGRENIYLNGTILGMTKNEISKKLDEIIDFSECGQFIDTPVKRYSSGMYVKLAFSVAAHLDSEILVMDEVLAVGDMKFQQKCLGKMGDVAGQGKTILYVSHNMNTIEQLCNRVVVLEHGKKKFEGNVDEGIEVYMKNTKDMQVYNDLSQIKRQENDVNGYAKMLIVEILDKKDCIFRSNEILKFNIKWRAYKNLQNMCMRMIILYPDGNPAGMMTTKPLISAKENETIETVFEADIRNLAPGKYTVKLVLYFVNDYGTFNHIDVVQDAFRFEMAHNNNESNNLQWQHRWWGHVRFPEIQIKY